MLEEKILNDYQKALKERDTVKSSALNFLRAELINVAMAKKKKKLDDNEVLAVIKKQINQRRDSIEQFKIGNRQDLVDKESRELEILKVYLPAQLSVEEIKKIIEEAIVAMGAQGQQDMGRVMKEIMTKVGQVADGRLVSELVRNRLLKPAP